MSAKFPKWGSRVFFDRQSNVKERVLLIILQLQRDIYYINGQMGHPRKMKNLLTYLLRIMSVSANSVSKYFRTLLHINQCGFLKSVFSTILGEERTTALKKENN